MENEANRARTDQHACALHHHHQQQQQGQLQTKLSHHRQAACRINLVQLFGLVAHQGNRRAAERLQQVDGLELCAQNIPDGQRGRSHLRQLQMRPGWKRPESDVEKSATNTTTSGFCH